MDNEIAYQKKKGKGKQEETELEVEKQQEESQENCLATLDIFAGCGGLSEGLHQSGTVYLSVYFINLCVLSHIYFLGTLCPTIFCYYWYRCIIN